MAKDIGTNFVITPLVVGTSGILANTALKDILANVIYDAEMIEIVEVNKTTGEVTSTPKNYITLRQGGQIIFNKMLTRALSSASPTVAVKITGITNNTQFDLETQKVNSSDTDLYEIRINFYLKVRNA